MVVLDGLSDQRNLTSLENISMTSQLTHDLFHDLFLVISPDKILLDLDLDLLGPVLAVANVLNGRMNTPLTVNTVNEQCAAIILDSRTRIISPA